MKLPHNIINDANVATPWRLRRPRQLNCDAEASKWAVIYCFYMTDVFDLMNFVILFDNRLSLPIEI